MIQSTKLKRARNDTTRTRGHFIRRSKTVSLLQHPVTMRKSIRFVALSIPMALRNFKKRWFLRYRCYLKWSISIPLSRDNAKKKCAQAANWHIKQFFIEKFRIWCASYFNFLLTFSFKNSLLILYLNIYIVKYFFLRNITTTINQV